ncbi:MAG: peptidoglycan binding protein CsiV [Xanthomonadales bacterium]|nr:peptidoglycan binding protein CsiV [Xanthomonadales bacterium]
MYTYKPNKWFFSGHALQLLCVLAVLFSSASIAQSENPLLSEPEEVAADFFRIELVLYKVIDSNGNGRLSQTISDYTDPIILDELLVEVEAELEVNTLDQTDKSPEEVEIPQSEVMENAWKRLRGSRNFRPLMYTQWNELRADTVARHAPGGVKGAAIRIHGETILPEPFGHEPETIPVDITPANSLTELIEIEPTYKLDGKASFGQGRFLHINIDFEYREWNAGDFNNTIDQQVSMEPEAVEETTAQAPAYKIYSLKKTRQIVPLKPELFDTEQFGVLVYLEAISPINAANATDITTNDGN